MKLSDNNSDTYIVKKGDSLYSIEEKYDTTVNELKKLNNLISNDLSIGQKLQLPQNAKQNNVYTVKKGDSLYSIAQRFNTTVDNLKRINNLNNNILQIGEQLKISN